MTQLIKNETWSLVEPPPGRAPIKNRWVFKIKKNGQNNVKFKARLVAKGFSQRPGIDYGENYSPVVKHDSLRTILSLASAQTRRSTTGNIFILNGGPVSWRSQKQKCVALSTAESEYIAASMATKEVVWLRRLLMEIGCQQNNSTPLFCDNQSAIRLVYNPEFHQRTKHIDVKFHHIRDMQIQQEISIQYIPTENQLANALTKKSNHQKLSKFKHSMECVHLYKLYEMFLSIQFFSCFVIEWVCWSKSAIWRDVQSLHSHENGLPTLSTPCSQIKMSVVNVSSISDISRPHSLQ